MKKASLIAFLLAASKIHAAVNLDMAILSTASNLTGALERGTSIAVLPVLWMNEAIHG